MLSPKQHAELGSLFENLALSESSVNTLTSMWTFLLISTNSKRKANKEEEGDRRNHFLIPSFPFQMKLHLVGQSFDVWITKRSSRFLLKFLVLVVHRISSYLPLEKKKTAPRRASLLCWQTELRMWLTCQTHRKELLLGRKRETKPIDSVSQHNVLGRIIKVLSRGKPVASSAQHALPTWNESPAKFHLPIQIPCPVRTLAGSETFPCRDGQNKRIGTKILRKRTTLSFGWIINQKDTNEQKTTLHNEEKKKRLKKTFPSFFLMVHRLQAAWPSRADSTTQNEPDTIDDLRILLADPHTSASGIQHLKLTSKFFFFFEKMEKRKEWRSWMLYFQMRKCVNVDSFT